MLRKIFLLSSSFLICSQQCCNRGKHFENHFHMGISSVLSYLYNLWSCALVPCTKYNKVLGRRQQDPAALPCHESCPSDYHT